MNMMQMVGIMTFCFFVALTAICLYHKFINVRIGNLIFIVADIVFFFAWNYAAYQLGWLRDGFMTLENISPFIMTLIPFTVFLNERVKKYCNCAIAFLWIGMFLALGISPQHSYIFNFNHEANLIYSAEAACHLIASLYGIYLIISGQVICDFKHWLKSVICMFSVITFGVVLNYFFHLDNFGMDPYGDYSIYMLDIFGSFGATLIAYYLGVLVVLTLGMQIGYVVNKMVSKIHLETSDKAKNEENLPSLEEADEKKEFSATE